MSIYDNYNQVRPVFDRKLSQIISILALGIVIGFITSQLTGDATSNLPTYIQYEQPVQFEDWHGNVKRSSGS
jgi:hypothetical protein